MPEWERIHLDFILCMLLLDCLLEGISKLPLGKYFEGLQFLLKIFWLEVLNEIHVVSH